MQPPAPTSQPSWRTADSPDRARRRRIELRVVHPLLSCVAHILGAMDVTLLYFDGCPSWQEADAHLISIGAEMANLTVHYQLVETADAAQRYRFRGSPSIHIDGVDLFAQDDDPVGLSCRVYQTPNGLAGSPTLEQLRSALLAATNRP